MVQTRIDEVRLVLDLAAHVVQWIRSSAKRRLGLTLSQKMQVQVLETPAQKALKKSIDDEMDALMDDEERYDVLKALLGEYRDQNVPAYDVEDFLFVPCTPT